MNSVESCPAPSRDRCRSAILIWLALVVAWFARALFTDATLLSFDERIVPPFSRDADPLVATRPQNFITSDLQGWILAHSETAVARIEKGELPLWDPAELLGRPLHGDASFPTFYLPDAIYLALPVLDAYAWSMALHFAFAGLGMLLLLMRSGVRPAPALCGAIAFGMSGWMLVHLHIPHFVRTGAWLPWLVLASLRLAARPGPGRAATLALAVGMAALSAYPPVLGVMLFGLLLAAVVFVVRSEARVRAAAWHGAALACGGLLGAVSLLPVAELRAASLRSGNVSEATAIEKSLRPAHLVSLAAPDFQGHPVDLQQEGFVPTETYPVARELFSVEVQDNYVENTLYGGVAALLLALAAVASARRHPPTWGFLLLLLLAVAIAAHSPLQRLFRDHLVPGLGSGSPKRVLLLGAFALAGLAAIGLDRLLRGDRVARLALAGAGIAVAGACALGLAVSLDALSWWGGGTPAEQLPRIERLLRRAFLVPIVAAAAIALLAWPLARAGRARGLAAAALVALLAADLAWFGFRFNPLQPPQARGARTEVVDFLREPGRQGRTARLRERSLLPASIVSAWGIESVDGIQALLVREVAELLETWQPGCIDPRNPNQVASFAHVERFGLPVTDLLARWIVWHPPAPPPELGFEMRYASERESLAVSENPRALPRVFLADRACVIADREARLAAVTSPRFAPARVAIVESSEAVAALPPESIVPDESMPADPASAVAVDAKRESPERWRIRVESPAAGILVVTEAFFPGWRVREGGASRDPIRVDHAFLGIPLAAGVHDLVLEYDPASFRLGAWLSLAALAGIVALALLPRVLRRAPAPDSGTHG